MATVKGVVENVSTKFEKYSIQVNGNWYGTKMEYANVKPNRGDEVEFDDGGKKYTSRLKITKAGSGGSAPSGGAKGGYSSLGVELGHASNLAMRVMEQKFTLLSMSDEHPEVGSTEYWKDFVTQTEMVYKIMQGLRAKYESADKPEAKPEVKEETVVMKAEPKSEEPIDASDLF